MRKSQLSASSKPPVIATPLIAPISGLVRDGNGLELPTGVSLNRLVRSSPIIFRSSPAVNAGSVPVKIMTCTSSLASNFASDERRARRMAGLIALRASGRCIVSVPMPLLTSTRTG